MKMKKQMFMYCILHHKHTETDKGMVYDSTSIIQEPKYILGSDTKEVAFKAIREVPESVASDSENIEIIVRPF